MEEKKSEPAKTKNAQVITKTALRRLMKEEGQVEIVSLDAVFALQEFLQDRVIEITKKALGLAEHAKRKTVMRDDLKLSL